ncbi:MAG: cytochrome c, class I, partial [Gammaproteobacteria bacterium]|nr:cytochrome c, class I [Gammaproteobacteria bacterium]
MAKMIRTMLLAGLLCFGTALADDDRARFNYMIHCQGCHLPDAEGYSGRVPRMSDFLGYFLHSQEGRDFIIRVPGVSLAQLSDDEIAELMNWLINVYSAKQGPADFVPFTASEVGVLRQSPEDDPLVTRLRILRTIA